MALLQLYKKHSVEDKHCHKPSIQQPYVSLLLIVFLVVSVVPRPALAFEAELSHAPAKRLVAIVKLQQQELQSGVVVAHLPDYSYRMSGTITAYPPVQTEVGSWRSTRIAFRPDVQNVSEPVVAPDPGSPLVLQGEASFYSRSGCLGCNALRIMANGQPLNDAALTMAIGADKKHLVGRTAKVTNLTTGQSVEVRITDTGGFYQAHYGQRVADLTIATKQAIGMTGGVGQVEVEVH